MPNAVKSKDLLPKHPENTTMLKDKIIVKTTENNLFITFLNSRARLREININYIVLKKCLKIKFILTNLFAFVKIIRYYNE